MKPPGFLADRDPHTAKWHYGHALLVAGAYGRLGCALLAGRACLRTGAGLLTMHVPARCVDPAQTSLPEAMLDIDPDSGLWRSLPAHPERYSAVAVGPGIGLDPQTADALLCLLRQLPDSTPLILDADALSLMALRPEIAQYLPRLRAILTPHEREMARFHCSPEALSQHTRATIVLKGHTTQIFSPDGHKSLITTGNAGMATAGSGDVLTGILLGLAAQNAMYSSELRISEKKLATLGVQIHGISGEIYARNHPMCTLIASDLIKNLPTAIAELSAR